MDPKALQYIYYASDGAKRMKQIILDLLEYSRAGKFMEGPKTINLNNLLADYKVLRNRVITEKNVTIITNKLPIIESYKTPLIQTFHSIIDNAIKYAKNDLPPVIKIDVEQNKIAWIVKIEDNGIGIDPQYFDKIFVMFQRLHNKDEYSGTGIGLAVAKKNVESWGGNIWIESELGSGTTFYFTIKKCHV